MIAQAKILRNWFLRISVGAAICLSGCGVVDPLKISPTLQEICAIPDASISAILSTVQAHKESGISYSDEILSAQTCDTLQCVNCVIACINQVYGR